MHRLIPGAYTLFVLGGLLSGTLGITQIATFAETREAQPPKASSTPVEATPVSVMPLVPAGPRVTVSSPTATPVTDKVPDPRWSLLYVVDGDLWETTRDGPLQLTHSGRIGQPAAGEGALVFVEQSRNGSDVWLASADAPPRPITQNMAPSVAQNHWATEPVFLPGSQRLYELSDYNKSTSGVGDLAVWELGFDLAPPVQITRPPSYAGGDQDVSVDPEDPGQIVFTRYAYAGSQLVEQLEWLNVPTGRMVTLTPPDQPARQASFSPDASALAFVQRSDDAQEDLYVADIQTAEGPQLEDPRQAASGVIANPAWCPDGNTLIYLALVQEQFQVWSVAVERDADGTETFGTPHQMTTGPSVDASSRPVCMTPGMADEVREWLAATPASP